MAVVIELLNRSGRIVERHRFSNSVIAVGRSYKNDIIINDEYVDPFHLNIELREDGSFTIHDNSSLNGVKIQKGKRIDVSSTINSGDTIEFGRTRLRIIDPFHTVSPAERLSRTDKLLSELSSWPYIIVLLAAVMGKEVWILYSNTPGNFNISLYYSGLMNLAFVLLIYIVAWSAIGRLLRGETRYLSHAICIMLALLSYWLYTLLQVFIIYNFDWVLQMSIVDTVITALLVATLSWLGLYLSTNASSPNAALCAAIVSALWLIQPHLFSEKEHTGFSPFPNHNSVLLAPIFQVTKPINIDEYLHSMDTLFNNSHDTEIEHKEPND